MSEVDMKVRIGNLELDNPFILGAGPPGITGESLKRFATARPGAVVTKSIGVKPSPGQKLSLSKSALSDDSLVLTDPWPSSLSSSGWSTRSLSPRKAGSP